MTLFAPNTSGMSAVDLVWLPGDSACGECDASYVGVIFDDSPVTTRAFPQSGCPPYTGRYRTHSSSFGDGLFDLSGDRPAGTWELRIVNGDGDPGQTPAVLKAWRLVFNSASAEQGTLTICQDNPDP